MKAIYSLLGFIILTLPLDITQLISQNLQVITAENAAKIEQLAVIAPDGHDLTGSDNVDVQYFAEQPAGSQHWISSIAFSPDGQRLAAGSYDTSVRVWNLQTGEQLLTLLGHQELVNDVAFSPDGSLLASCSGAFDWYQDFSVRLWNTNTGKMVSILKGHTDQVMNVAFSPDGTKIASASFDGTIRVWNINTGKELLTIHVGNERMYDVQFDSSGQYVLSAGADDAIKIWDADTGVLVRSMHEDDWIYSAEFNPDGTLIISSNRDGMVHLWDANTGELKAVYPISHGETDKDGFALLLSEATFDPSGVLFAVGFGSSIRVWSIPDKSALAHLEGHSGDVFDVKFSPDGTILASASFDGSIRLWGVPSNNG
jgi:WD40 repeat protein